DADGQVSMAQIAQAGLVMYPQTQLPAFYAAILDAMRKGGHDAHVNQEASLTLTVLSCVAGGCGVALLPSWIRSMGFRGVRFCEVRDGER
ncbi:LysR substrate-binding domain-containing protein, partial [Achromobacter animicus]